MSYYYVMYAFETEDGQDFDTSERLDTKQQALIECARLSKMGNTCQIFEVTDDYETMVSTHTEYDSVTGVKIGEETYEIPEWEGFT